MRTILALFVVCLLAGCAQGGESSYQEQVVCHNADGHIVRSDSANAWGVPSRNDTWYGYYVSFAPPVGYSCHVERAR